MDIKNNRLIFTLNVGVQVLEPGLGVGRVHGQCKRDLLVDYNIDPDSILRLLLEQSVQSELFVLLWWATKVL